VSGGLHRPAGFEGSVGAPENRLIMRLVEDLPMSRNLGVVGP
jgi:hypothetical protein